MVALVVMGNECPPERLAAVVRQLGGAVQVVRDMPAAFDDDITDVALCGDEVVGEHCPPTTARIWRFRDHGEEKGEPLPAADIM